MPKTVRLILDTQRTNHRFTVYDPDVVMTPLEQAASLVDAFHQQKAEIDSDRHLTPQGKAAARIKDIQECSAADTDLQHTAIKATFKVEILTESQLG